MKGRLQSTSGGSGSAGANGFGIIQPPNGTSPTATQADDTLTFTSSDGSVVITGTAASKTVDFSADDTNLTPDTVSINGAPATGALNVQAQGSGLTSQFNLVSSGGVVVFSICVRDTGDIFYFNGSNILYNHVGGTSSSGVGPSAAQSLWDMQASDSATTVTAFGGYDGGSVRNTDSTNGNFAVMAFGDLHSNTSAIAGVNDSHATSAQTGHLSFMTKILGTMSECVWIGATGMLNILTAGAGLTVKENAGNAKMGTATLNGVTPVVIANTAVTSNSRIMMTIQAPGGTVGSCYVYARTAGASFSIASTGAADTSTVAYMMVEPS